MDGVCQDARVHGTGGGVLEENGSDDSVVLCWLRSVNAAYRPLKAVGPSSSLGGATLNFFGRLRVAALL